MPTFGDATALLKDSEWLTRLARGLCGDRELAEDVAQEAMLAAWQTRGGIRGALRPWLVGAVRRLIANRGRAEVRRWRRERSAEPRAGSNAVPATDEVVARAALQQDVVQEVMALDEPYRTAVLLRYFDDLSCREISARVGAPLETVRSRVKRGVLQLRERLDRRHGSRSAWLLPVASTFGTNVPSTSLGAVAAAAVMVILVNVKLLVVAAVAVVFGLLFWLPDAPLAAPSNAGGAAADGVASSEPAESTGVVGDASDTATPAPVDRVATADVAIEVFGRVLWDNGGEPVEGATVQLILPMSEDPGGGVAYVPAMDPNEPVPEERVLAELATKADGTFALQLRDPVAALQCIVRHDDAWAEISQVLRSRRGAAVDLGTLRLCEAVMIRGRVRDTGDRPVADTEVNVLPRNRRDTPDRWIASGRGYPPVTTDANGEFRLPRPLPTGEYWVYYGDRALEAVNSNFVVTRDDAFLDLRVHRGADVVRGVVVDADGEPVEGLAVSCTGGRSSGDTDSSGAFEVRRSRGGSATTTVSIWRHRFHIAELLSETEVDWGREDLRIELGPTVDLSVQVVQAPAMTPVEAFDLQLHRQGTRQWMPGGLRFSSGYSGGMRRGGVMRFEGMMPGRYRALVVRRHYSVQLELDVVVGTTAARLVLPPVAEMVVEVVDTNGEPVAGAACDLFFQVGELSEWAGLDLLASTAGKGGGGTTQLPATGQLVRGAGGATNERGELTVPLPHALGATAGGRLRVVADGYAPSLVDVTDRAGATRLLVELRFGAKLKGRLGNASFMRESANAYVFLRSMAEPRIWFPRRVAWKKAKAAVGADGTFELPNVPVQDWQIWLGFQTPGRTGAMIYQSLPIGEVRGLEDGEVRALLLDGASAAPVPVTGTVLIDGQAVPHARLNFRMQEGGRSAHGSGDSDDRGRFQTELSPGLYDVEAAFVDRATGAHAAAVSVGKVVVPVRGPVEVNIDLRRK